MRQQDALEEALMTERDDDGLGRDRSTDDMALIEAMCNAEGPAASTSEIAEAVGMTGAGVNHRLSQLEEKGVVRCKNTGNGIIWWPDFYPIESSESND
jgi:LexA DNA binding domain.